MQESLPLITCIKPRVIFSNAATSPSPIFSPLCFINMKIQRCGSVIQSVKMAEMSESGRREEGIELDLGLAIGRSFRNPGRPTLMAEESGFPGGEIRRCESMRAHAGNESLATDLKKKLEIHALNRQEAKRKQGEKRKRREIARRTGLDCGSEGEEQNHRRRNKKERIQKAIDLNLSNERDSSPPCRPSPIIPMQYSNSPLQYLPITALNGFVIPCVMPWWGPGSGAGNFNPYRDNHFFNQSIGCNVDNEDNKKISDGSPVCSSPVVADNQSCANEDDGSRSDSRSHSSQSLAEHESNGSINQFDHAASSRRADDRSVMQSFGKPSVSGEWEVAESNKIIKTANNGSLSLASMPCVSTIGEGPDSKRIIGFLYRYSKSEVSIVCVCHGEGFSPAEFVKHAGGTEVSNPLRHITVIPSAFA